MVYNSFMDKEYPLSSDPTREYSMEVYSAVKRILNLVELAIYLVLIIICVLLYTIGSREWLIVVYPLSVILMFTLLIVAGMKRSVDLDMKEN